MGGIGGEMLRGVPGICRPLTSQASPARWGHLGGGVGGERVGREILAALWNVPEHKHHPPSHYSPLAALNFLIVGPLYTLKNG